MFSLLCAWIIASGLDDLFIDLASLVRLWRARRAPVPSIPDVGEPPGSIAIVVPCWHEHEVIGRMLEHNLAAIRYADYDIFVGAYPNDDATLSAVRLVEARHPRVHLALVPHDGPTSKADCLNWVVQHIELVEEQRGRRFGAILMHDAEDLIHPLELVRVTEELRDHDFVQVPVLALPTPWHDVTHGVYCDEFAESQTKELPTRVWLGGFLPSCGVGTGITRAMLDRLAATNANRVFEPECLTEDYELGRRVQELGGRQKMILGHDVATREYFPRDRRFAVRQRTRWITGISLQGWDRNGWGRGPRDWYWFWRDRKGLVGNPLTLLTNALFLAGLAGFRFEAAMPLVWAGLGFQCYRILVRAWFSGQLYGWRFALGVPLRILWGNAINSLATLRAIRQFACAKWRGEPLRWLKTSHAYPSREALMMHKRRLGEILVELKMVTEEQLANALAAQPQDLPLGEYLVHLGLLSDSARWLALSVQQGIDVRDVTPDEIDPRAARCLPRQLIETRKVFPVRIAAGQLLVAAAALPSDELLRELSATTKLRVEFTLITEHNLARLVSSLL